MKTNFSSLTIQFAVWSVHVITKFPSHYKSIHPFNATMDDGITLNTIIFAQKSNDTLELRVFYTSFCSSYLPQMNWVEIVTSIFSNPCKLSFKQCLIRILMCKIKLLKRKIKIDFVFLSSTWDHRWTFTYS